MSSLREKSSINENRKNNIFSVCASEECKIFTSWCQSRGFKGWKKKWGKFPDEPLSWNTSRKKLHKRQDRDSPKKEGIRIACREQGPGTAQVPWCFVLPSWLCAGSSSIYHFHFLKIGTILLSVSTVWFFLYAKGYPCSGFLLFPSGTQCDWCVPYSTKLSLADPILSPELHYPLKGNSSHKVRNRGIWALVIFQGITVLAHVEIIHMC